MIGGEEEYIRNTLVPMDTKVVVTYHTFPENIPKAENTEQSSDDGTLGNGEEVKPAIMLPDDVTIGAMSDNAEDKLEDIFLLDIM